MGRRWIMIAVSATLAIGMSVYAFARPVWFPVWVKVSGGRSVDDVVSALHSTVGPAVRAEVEAVGASWPPKRVTFIALKDERQFETWVEVNGAWRLARRDLIRGASGTAGPKLREGDRQVPEGVYAIAGLNPNSRFHLSMKVGYPNAFDAAHAQRDGRTAPGTNIFIHGGSASIGCLAMGDDTIEALFLLAAQCGAENVRIIIAPHDLRRDPAPPRGVELPAWSDDLYRDLRTALAPFGST